jgi:hypothetical protein
MKNLEADCTGTRLCGDMVVQNDKLRQVESRPQVVRGEPEGEGETRHQAASGRKAESSLCTPYIAGRWFVAAYL